MILKNNIKTVVLIILIASITSCKGKTDYDIVIYGGTSAGIIAAVQATRMGKSVIVIEPGNHLGGLTTGGLGQTDIGNKQVIGGISREFYERIAQKYSKPETWRWQRREDYKNLGQGIKVSSGVSMWTFEPKVAQAVFQDLIREHNILFVLNEKLDLIKGVVKKSGKIQSIVMESGEKISGKVFIDATYEGDLLAQAGVSYTVGRESNEKYGETLNGLQTEMAVYFQFPDGVDPYVVKGDPSSGLLPNVNNKSGEEGEGDKNVQAYCFRSCLTDEPYNRMPFEKPIEYSELEYELLFRAIEAGYEGPFFIMSKMPNRKTDSNNKGPLGSDYIGRNYDYAEGDYKTREEIIRSHEIYQRGLLWTLANHPRIPEKVRKEYSRWGLPKDEFINDDHWPPQLYIREARRMVSDFVMTQHHCTQDSNQARWLPQLYVKETRLMDKDMNMRQSLSIEPITADHSVGMGAYTMDSHHTQRYVDKNGFVKNEGDIEVKGFGPYPISYKAIVPKKGECTNLVVPVCLSATHIAFGSIRMEPVFMVLGQSAATAASLAIDGDIPVQEVAYEQLRPLLLEGKQVLEN